MAITFVSSTGVTVATAASTWSIPSPSGLVAGGCLVVGLGPASSAVTVSTVTDNAGNVYQLGRRRGTPLPAAAAELWYACNIATASTRISVTLSASSSGGLGALHLNGVSTMNALIGAGDNAITANSTTHDAAELTPAQSSAAVVVLHRVNASTIGTITNGPSLTTWLTTNATGPARMHGMYWIQGAASTTRGRMTTSSNCQHSAVILVLSDTNTVKPCPCNFQLMGVV